MFLGEKTHAGRRRLTALGPILVLGLALGAAAPPASAAPVVTIKARTDIKLLPILKQEQGVLVRGDLIDQASQRPIHAQTVTVRMNKRRQQVTTNEYGRFEAVFRYNDDSYDISVSFAASDKYAASQAELSGIDVEKQNVILGLRVDDPNLTGDNLEVTLEANTDNGVAAAISADLYAGSVGEDLRYITKLSTDMRGIGTFSLERSTLGRLGRKRLEVKFLGDRAYNPTQAQAEVVLSTTTRTTLSLRANRIAFEDSTEASGVVADERGLGIDDVTVALRAGGRRLASAQTDEDGKFVFSVAGNQLGPGNVSLQASFDSRKPWYIKSRSSVLQITVAEPQPVPVRHTLAAFGATAIAMLAFLGLRTRPWQGLLDRIKRWRSREPAADDSDSETPAVPVGGLRASAPSLVSSLRRPHVFAFNGTVRDAVTERRIGGAVILISHPDHHQHRLETDRRGRFDIDELVAGIWEAEVRYPGYVTEGFSLTVPHRGEFSGVRIELVSVRERIFAMYREIAEPLLPSRDKWGIWTPRQIFRHVREDNPAEALAELTSFVEETYFSQRTPNESVLPNAARLIEQVRGEHQIPETPQRMHTGIPL